MSLDEMYKFSNEHLLGIFTSCFKNSSGEKTALNDKHMKLGLGAIS